MKAVEVKSGAEVIAGCIGERERERESWYFGDKNIFLKTHIKTHVFFTDSISIIIID